MTLMIYHEHILAVNTTSPSDGGTYTCQVIATGGHDNNGRFTFTVNGTIHAVSYSIYRE